MRRYVIINEDCYLGPINKSFPIFRTPGRSTISGPSTQLSDFRELDRNHHSTPRSKEAEDVSHHNGGPFFRYPVDESINLQHGDIVLLAYSSDGKPQFGFLK